MPEVRDRILELLANTLPLGSLTTRGRLSCILQEGLLVFSQRRRKGKDMNDIRLTRRGKVVVAILAGLGLYFVAAAALNSVTPDECKVPSDQMSQGCIALIYK